VNAAWTIRAATAGDASQWAALRSALWPHGDPLAVLLAEIPRMLAAARLMNFVAVDAAGALIGFAEVSLRHDYVNGADTSPVGFLEGWYVAPAWRKQGVGRALVDAVVQWTRAQGCTEFASDALLDNTLSYRAHLACGFEETERVVYFRKHLAP
jgi:aminoglycoside 6'-N-acetyltransferase I